MRAKDVMTSPVVTARPDAALADVADLMVRKGVGSVVVVDPDGRPVGIVTESDFGAREGGVPFSVFTAPQVLGEWVGKDGVERIYARSRERPVRDVMSEPVLTVTEDTDLDDAVKMMLERRVSRIPVVRDGRVVGILSRHDLLRLLAR